MVESLRPPDPDAALLAEAASGDREAFDELVRRHRDAVYRWTRSITGRDDAAEDVLQETFLAAFRHAGSFEGRSSVRTWLLTIARNQARRRHRRPEPQPETEPSLERLGLAAGWGSEPTDPEGETSRAEQLERLTAALGRLREEDRQVLVARDLEGLSGPETAALLDISLPAMKAQLHRARLRLVAEFHGVGGDDDDNQEGQQEDERDGT